MNRSQRRDQAQTQQNEVDYIRELEQKLRSQKIQDFTEEEIFHPDASIGYIKRIMESREAKNITSVQLRKIFQEFKIVLDKVKREEKEKAMARLYRLYPILEYQEKRGVLPESFKNLIFAIIKNVENNKDSEKAFERAHDLLMAMVAYSKKIA